MNMAGESYPVRNLIVDHDGGSDDFAALAFTMLAPSVKVHAVTICPADSYREPATQVTLALVTRLGGNSVKVATGDDEGPNPFPQAWREDSRKIAQIPGLELPSTTAIKRLMSVRSAPEELVARLSGREHFDMLFTGPLTNLAAALRLKPTIAKNIDRVYFMGGALEVVGNVKREVGAPVAEWNLYNNPTAAAEVLRAKIPVTFIPLDATNRVPLTIDFMTALKRQRHFALSRLFLEIWAVVREQIEVFDYQKRYFFWDLLAAAVAVDPTIVRLKARTVRILESGPEKGRLIDDSAGNTALIATEPDAARLHRIVLNALKR